MSKRKDAKTNVKEHIATKLLITWQMIPLKYFIKITEKKFHVLCLLSVNSLVIFGQ